MRALRRIGVVARECATLQHTLPANRKNLHQQSALGADAFDDADCAEVANTVANLKCRGDFGVKGSGHVFTLNTVQ